MLFWIINFFILLSYGCICKMIRKDKLFLTISCIHIGLIMALRDISVGTDTYNYASAYNIIRSAGHLPMKHVASLSNVFLLILKIFSFLPDTQGYMIITSVPIMAIFYCFVKKYSKSYYLSVATFLTSYLYFYSMNAARHYLAIALVFVCFMLLENRRILLSIIIFIFACSIHNAVSIFFLYFIIYTVKWNCQRLGFFAVGSILFMKTVPALIKVFVVIFPHYSWLSSKIFNRAYISGGKTSLVYALISMIVVILNSLALMRNENIISIKFNAKEITGEKCMDESELQLTYRITCMMVFTMSMFFIYANSTLISRMTYVFFSFIVIALPNALLLFINEHRLFAAVIYIPLIIFVFLQLQGNYSGVLNYSFGF